jgi:ATP-dependent Clp protease adaptor protein ClpS
MSEQQPDIIEVVREHTQERTKEPPMYRVLLHNDDFTTKEFVVEILMYVFHKPMNEAMALMWRVHRRGTGVAGVFAREIAETKITTVTSIARENGFPLRVTMEPE